MARAIDADAVKRRAWDIAEAWKDQGRDYEALLLESVVEQIVDTQPTLTPPNEPLTMEDAKKERYIWFTPLNDWAKVTPFGVLFFGSEELMTWETLCEEWGYRFKAYRRPPEGEDGDANHA